MDGIIILNKPVGISSAQALYRVRAWTGVRHSGHAGTLDPQADGVLLLCLGKATGCVEALMDQPKVYRAAARLDATSSSYDSGRPLLELAGLSPPSPSRLHDALRSFEGTIQQAPPAVSAVKVGGVRAYKLERQGKVVALAPRAVRVYWIALEQYEWPRLVVTVACGRGTYVRALVRDVGEALGVGGCLTALTRLAIGPFRIEDAWDLEAIQRLAGDGSQRAALCVPLERARELLASADVPARPHSESS
jgi:tRNA pseudouridine55 synthase